MTDENSTQVIEWNVNDQAIAEIAEACKDVDAYQDLDAAKAAKRGLTKMRTRLSEAHKETKSKALKFGRDCDAEKNRLLAKIKEIEDPITADLDEIKNKEAREEENRIARLTAEIQRIQAYAEDRHSLELEELEDRLINLRGQQIEPEDMQEFVEAWDLAKQEADLKLRITIDHEKTALAEQAEQARVAEENAAKQKELDERQAKMDAEEAERQAERDKDDAERRVREDAEAAERKRKQDLIDEAQRKAQKKIDDENERIDREHNERVAEEERKRLEVEEAANRLRLAPDSAKLVAFAEQIEQVVIPTLDSQEATRVFTLAMEKIKPALEYIRIEARKMK